MPNIATVFKEEIARVARKELRDEFAHLRKLVATHRSDIAELKRRNKALEQLVRQLSKSKAGVVSSAPQEPADQVDKLRFSGKRLAAQRQRLGLSAADFGLLIGASGQSVYKWEDGAVRPRAKQLQAIAALRGIGKREAMARLQAVKASR